MASGITFVHHIVDDAGKDYKAVHYDHGTALCSADVDGDGLPDLYFVSELGTSELWRNLGGGRFENITAQSGLTMNDAIAVGASFADIDNDGDPDLFVTTVRHGNHLFENASRGKFRDITKAAGVGYVGHSSGATFFDYDGDGRLDLFVSNVGNYTTNVKGPGGYYVGRVDAFHGHRYPERSESSILYRNLGGNRFRDVSRAAGLVDLGWNGDATPIDANEDGRPDLYVLDMQGADHLWVNDGGKHFRDETATYFPRTPWGSMGAKVFDFNGDGRLDLFVTDMHSDMFSDVSARNPDSEARKSDVFNMPEAFFPPGKTRFVFGNAFFTKRDVPVGSAARPYTEVSDSIGAELYWPWGPSVGDLNADGWGDVFITAGMNFPFRYAPSSLLLNDGGRHFVASEFALGVEPREGEQSDQVWFTLDCKDADAGSRACSVCTSPNGTSMGCRDGDNGRYTVVGARGPRSAIVLDVDGDGDLDIVTNEFNASPRVLVSDLAARHPVHYLAVRLRGNRSNRNGLGALVTVVMPNGRRMVQPMDGKSGYLSQSDVPLYFGLGEANAATAIEVHWPSGRRQTIAGPIRAAARSTSWSRERPRVRATSLRRGQTMRQMWYDVWSARITAPTFAASQTTPPDES